MRQLRGKGDHPVVFFRRGDGEFSELRRGKQVLGALQQVNVVEDRRDEDHRRAVVQICPRVFKARIVRACHRMPAEVGKAMFLRQREKCPADHALGTAAVNDHRLFADVRQHLRDVCDGGFGVDGNEDDVARADVLFGERRGDRAFNLCKGQNALVAVKGEDLMSCLAVCLCKRASDQTQTDNSGSHCATASRTFMTFAESSTNCEGDSDCAPSHSA